MGAQALAQVSVDMRSMEQVLLQIGIEHEHARAFSHITLPFTLKPHQYTSLQGILAWQRDGLFDEARTGKTICMQLAAIWFRHFGLRSVFIMPPSLFLQFTREFKRIGGHKLAVHTLAQTAPLRQSFLARVRSGKASCDVLILTREIFKKHLAVLIELGFRVLFFDECHMGLQSEKMRTARGGMTIYAAVKQFAESHPDARIVLSTGTPVYNEPAGTYPIISLKSPNAYRSRREFDYRHVAFRKITISTPRGTKLVDVIDSSGYRNLDLLSRNLYHQATRALKLEVLDVHSPNIQTTPVKLHSGHMGLYRQIMRDRVMEMGEELIDARQQAKLRSLALQLLVTPGKVSTKKVKNAVLETLDDLLNTVDTRHNKVLIFATHTASVETVEAHLKSLNPVTIYGPNGGEINRKNIDRFVSDHKCRVAISNPVAGGVGLTFGQVCQTVIIVEPMSVPGQFDQAVSRVILSGQTEPVVVYILSIENTISPKAIEAMRGKGAISKTVTKDKKTMLDELLGN